MHTTIEATKKPGKTEIQSKTIGRIAGKIGVTLLGILTGIALLISALLVLLLPISTSVPDWVWILLAIADVAFIIPMFRVKPGWRGMATGFAGFVLVIFLAFILSQFFTMTPPITGADDKPLPGSIAILEQVDLNRSKQWISIRGKDVDKPVLLFLAGGPGGSQLVTERRALGELEDHFVVVNWEQPGAGKSFDAVDRSTLTPERYVTDGIELVRYLRARFDEDKVYIVGESWGSALGVWMVQRNPEYFHAFIGTGQMVAFLENDLMCYDFVLNLAQERGDIKKVEQLKKQGPPPYYGDGVAMREAAFLVETFNFMNADPAIADDGFNTFQDLAGSEYGLYDKLNWFRGALETMDVVYPHLWDVDFRAQAAQLDVPVYFLIGRHDVNAPPALAQGYFEILNAPQKEWFWFEHSGHNPWVTESDAFIDTIVNKILPSTHTVSQ